MSDKGTEVCVVHLITKVVTISFMANEEGISNLKMNTLSNDCDGSEIS